MADKDARYSWQVPRDRSLRASDGDRSAVGDILRREHVAGRIDADEFGERYGRSLEAKTYAQLDQLLADLPVREEEPAQAWPGSWYGPPAAPAPNGSRSWRSQPPRYARSWGPWRHFWPVALLFWLAVVGAIAVVSSGHLLWLAIPVLFIWARPRRWRSAKRRQGCGM